jgi:hypothetical protein
MNSDFIIASDIGATFYSALRSSKTSPSQIGSRLALRAETVVARRRACGDCSRFISLVEDEAFPLADDKTDAHKSLVARARRAAQLSDASRALSFLLAPQRNLLVVRNGFDGMPVVIVVGRSGTPTTGGSISFSRAGDPA